MSVRPITNDFMRSQKAFNRMLMIMGQTLAELREKKGFATIKEFTRKYDLPEIQYWRMEKGKANFTIKSLNKILRIHHLTMHEFFAMIAEEKEAV